MATSAISDRPKVLVIDDEPDLRTLYEFSLVREGYVVHTAEGVAQALQALQEQRFDAVISDMRLQDGLGLDVLKFLSQQQRSERCIVITAYGSAENAVEALKAGAFDYLTKPVDLKQFRSAVAQAVQSAQAATNGTGGQGSATSSALPSLAAKSSPTTPAAVPQNNQADATQPMALARMAGDSATMRAVRERVQKIARSMAPVLVRGESGTGKELVAQAVHACSHRASGPFVAVNCGAIPEALLEAEFFGARKGAYTGATQDREGYFQAAHGGTLFLDEIGDLPLSMQAKLLRVIQERSVRALGGTQEENVDTRIVSATHHDLAALVAKGLFRQDLYYRLNVIEIALPALRERREDLPQLTTALLARIAADTGQAPRAVSLAMKLALQSHPLVGNVRELENILHRALALSDGDELDMEGQTVAVSPQAGLAQTVSLPLEVPATANEATTPVAQNPSATAMPTDLQSHLDTQEKAILLQALTECGFNRTAAAARLGISLRQIRYRMVRLGIDAQIPAHAGDKDA
jgi:two-component system, NtrC family, response regulator PilR